MVELWRFSVIALNHDVSGRSHFIEIISHSFSILSSVESACHPALYSKKNHFVKSLVTDSLGGY